MILREPDIFLFSIVTAGHESSEENVEFFFVIFSITPSDSSKIGRAKS